MSILGWLITFLVAAIILGILGFGVLAAAAATVVKVLFYIALAIFIIMLISMAVRRTT